METRLVDKIKKDNRVLEEVFRTLKVIGSVSGADELLDGARRYYEDGTYFLSKGDYISSLEAFAISWAYIDAGLKLGLFIVSGELSVYFTA